MYHLFVWVLKEKVTLSKLRSRGYKTSLCSTQLSLKFIMLIIVGILTFIISRINDLLWGLKPEISIVFAIIFKVYGQLKFSCSAVLSMIIVL